MIESKKFVRRTETMCRDLKYTAHAALTIFFILAGVVVASAERVPYRYGPCPTGQSGSKCQGACTAGPVCLIKLCKAGYWEEAGTCVQSSCGKYPGCPPGVN